MFGGSSFGNSNFGGGGGFGQQNQNSTFGQANNSFGGFGQAAGFGQQNQQTGFNNNTSGFGSTPAFGQQSAQPTFGSTNSGGGLFGSTSNTTPAFGGFGSTSNTNSNNTTSGFGTSGSTGLFGQKSTFGSTSSGGTFGSNTFNSAANGTINPAYSVTQDKDTSTGVISLLQSITAMPAYRNYSFEELRVQDYAQGRKSAGQTGTTGFGQSNSFGSNTTGFGGSGTAFGTTPTSNAGGLFGSGNNQQTPGFGQSTGLSSGGFGANAGTATGSFGSTGFGSANTSTSPFGQNTSNTTGGFGTSNTTTSPFGQASTTPAFGSGGGFGNTTPSKPAFGFGSTNTSTTTSTPFGSTSAPSFGGANNATTGGFGFGSGNTSNTGFRSNTANTGFGSGGFGTAASTAPAAPSFSFGNNTGSSFGTTPATSTGFSFGSTNNALGTNTAAKPSFGFGNSTATSAPSGGLFGNSTATSTATPSLFGSNTSTTTPSLFGNSGTTNSFGSSLNTTANTTGGLFNKPAGAAGGLFGTSTAANTGSNTSFGFSNSGFGASTQNTANLGSSNQTPLQASIDKNPYGNNPLFSTLPTSSTNATSPLHNSVSNSDTLASSAAQKKKYPSTPHFKSTPRSSSKIKLRGFPLASSLSTSTYRPNSSTSVHLFESTNDDTILSPEAFTPKQSVKKLVINHKIGDTLDKSIPVFGESNQNSPSGTPKTNPRTVKFNPDLDTYHGHVNSESPKEIQENGVRTLSYLTTDVSDGNGLASSQVNTDFSTEYGTETSPAKLPPSEYWCSPSIDELKKKSKDSLKHITEFEVGRIGYGKVRFLETVDISGLDLSSILGGIVIFERKSCTVYPDESIKPEVGKGLNVPALISLDQCWPIDKSTRKFIKDRNSPRFQQHLKKMKAVPETEFVDFNLDDGAWSFIVQHFSRYGLDDEEDDEEPFISRNKSDLSVTPEIIAEESQQEANPNRLNDEDMADAPPVSWLSPESDHSENEELFNSMDESGIEDTFASPSQGNFVESAGSDYADIGMVGSHRGATSSADLFKSSSSVLNESQQPKPWAKQLGLEAHKVHVMQASLFRDNAQEDAPPLLKPVSTASTSWSSKSEYKPTTLQFGQDMDVSEEEEFTDDIPKSSTSQFSSVRLARPPKKCIRVSYEKSLSQSKSGCIVDAGLMMGRSFRVGWGPGGVMISPGRIVSLESLSDNSLAAESFSQINIQRVKVFQNEEFECQKHEITLETQLEHTEIALDDNGVPMASTSTDLHFKDFVEKLDLNSRKHFENHEVLVWKLAEALWDNVFVPPNDMLPGQALERLAAVHSKASFANWLKEAVRPEMLAHIQQLEAKGNSAGIIFAYITGNRISKACIECIKNRDFRLSTLISQAGGDAQSRIDIAHQVLKWKEYRFQSNINADYTRLYELLSGNIYPQSVDSVDRHDQTIYVHEGLDWKRTLGLFIWYASFLETSMAESVAKYEHAFLEQKCSVPVASPFPWYQKDSSNSKKHYDVLFGLIKVYTDLAYSLEDAILPLSISPSPLDYRLSWHLFIMLERVLGVRSFERYEDSMDSSPGANSCISFAFQLERLGLWKWAIFILLHLVDTNSREVAIRELISRHISIQSVEQDSASLPEIQFTDDEAFLVNTLKIPSDWIYEAKALQAKYNGMDYEEAVCLLHAAKWNQAHQLIVEKLAPDALLRDQIDRLKSLLSQVDSEQVSNWENGGLIFLEYIEIFERLPKILENQGASDLTDYDYMELKNQMTQLLRTLSRMKEKVFTNTQQTVCIAEMASRISRTLSEIDLVEHREQHLLKGLPLPEDQRLHAILKLSYFQLYSN